jgi:site-specific DNA-methyltransferase (adenine-specific)
MEMKDILNTVICGDCLSVMKTLPDKCVDLVLTDPPYKFETKGGGIALSDDKRYLRGCKDIGVSDDYDFTKDNSLLVECVRILKKVNMFFFCSKAQIVGLLNFAGANGYMFDLIPFCKTSPVPFTNNQWLPDREWGIHIHKSAKVCGSYATKRGYFFDATYKDESIDHPTPKPVSVITKLLDNLSDSGDLILDCFLGSGTTAVACKRTGRDFIGIEISPAYCETARLRILQAETGVSVKEQKAGQGALFL